MSMLDDLPYIGVEDNKKIVTLPGNIGTTRRPDYELIKRKPYIRQHDCVDALTGIRGCRDISNLLLLSPFAKELRFFYHLNINLIKSGEGNINYEIYKHTEMGKKLESVGAELGISRMELFFIFYEIDAFLEKAVKKGDLHKEGERTPADNGYMFSQTIEYEMKEFIAAAKKYQFRFPSELDDSCTTKLSPHLEFPSTLLNHPPPAKNPPPIIPLKEIQKILNTIIFPDAVCFGNALFDAYKDSERGAACSGMDIISTAYNRVSKELKLLKRNHLIFKNTEGKELLTKLAQKPFDSERAITKREVIIADGLIKKEMKNYRDSLKKHIKNSDSPNERISAWIGKQMTKFKKR